ncbi:MAG: Hsp20/alpha crystallin family protein [Bacteroidota bacterium]
MKLLKVKPNSRSSFFSHNLDHFFNDLMNHSFSDIFDEQFVNKRPAANVIASGDGFQLELAIPGLTKADIDLKIEKEVLTISAIKKADQPAEETKGKVKYSRREFDYTSFKRTFHLNETIDIAKISAVYENGVLLIQLPKKEEAVEKSRAIEIA